MGITDRIMNMSLKMKIIISAVAVAVIAAVVVAVFMTKGGYLATTMRLLRVEGTVNIEDANGGSKPVIDNIRFQSGDALNTGADGIASVGLDDTKIITLQNNSRAEFSKKRKQLELKLTQGSLFFEVTQHLKDDETFEIKTSTMTAGIRGTSGYVFCDEAGFWSLALTDGVVSITATNPKTGETKTAEVHGGQLLKVYTFDREVDSVDFTLENYQPNELPSDVLAGLKNNDALVDKICADTGWDKDRFKALIDKAAEGMLPKSTPTPVSTPADTPTTTPKTTSTPKPTITGIPTLTVTPTPEPTEVAEATTNTDDTEDTEEDEPASTTAAPTSTSTPVPTSTSTPAPEPTATETEPTEVEPEVPEGPEEPEEPDMPEGYDKLAWGSYYGGHDVYICTADGDYLGYVNGDWVVLTMVPTDGGARFLYDGEEYYVR